MDPLQGLWDLYEAVVPKPELAADPTSGMGSPNEDDGFVHPVSQDREKLDNMRAAGMDTGKAHEQVHGDTNLADIQSKSKLAATFGRVQDDGNKKAVFIDKEGEHKSILAIDDSIEDNEQVTQTDLSTRHDREIPDELERREEYDYNLDVQYLQTYGRA